MKPRTLAVIVVTLLVLLVSIGTTIGIAAA